jgi:DNA-binding beta-propeller fold protein YncE
VYVTNHAHGRPIGWVTVISGSTDQIVNTIYLDPAGELYGIAADNVHNRLYVASINAAVIYAIDAATDTQLGYLQVRRWLDNLPVPVRMIAVNPNPGLGSKIRLWLTSSSTEDNGLDNIISLTGDWPYMEQPFLGVNLPPSPERGLKFDPTTKAVIVASASSNRVTILWDTPQTQQCLWPFIAPSGASAGALTNPERSDGLYTIVHDFSAK